MHDVNREVSVTVEVAGPPTRGVSREFLEYELKHGPTSKLVLWRGWKLCRSLGLTRSHLEDFCQELAADLSRRAPGYRSDRASWIAFARLVLKHRASELADRFWHARSSENACAQALRPSVARRNHVSPELEPKPNLRPEHIDLRMDVGEAIASLQPRLAELCGILKAGFSTSEAARILRIPPTTARGWIARIRRRFEEQQLDKYLLKVSPVRRSSPVTNCDGSTSGDTQ